MTMAVLAGCGVGLGLSLLAGGLWPASRRLGAALALLHGPQEAAWQPPVAAESRAATPAWRLRLGRSLAALLRDAGVELRSVRKDLAVVGRTYEELLAEKALCMLLAPVLVAALAAALTLLGFHLSVALPLWASLLLAVGGFFLPDLALRSQAERRRLAFRHATASFLDLVAINLAGGTGVEGALESAARAGEGWPFQRLRDALAHARLTGETPWAALGRVGDQMDLPELSELAASLLLAGSEGAKVRQSLMAKAASLRQHQLADAERDAAEATERLALPIALLLVGFLIFLGFPATIRVLSGL